MQGRRLWLIGLVFAALCGITTSRTAAAPLTTFVVDSTGNGHDSDPGDHVCDDGTGKCTLRAALEQANFDGIAITINFSIAGSGVHTIANGGGTDNFPVVIDATTQTGYAGSPLIVLNGGGLGLAGGNSTVRGLVINNSNLAAITLSTLGNNLIEDNYLGTDATGTVALGNAVGVNIGGGSSNNMIRHNLISGNTEGVVINTSTTTGNTVQGNYIGTDVTGKAKLGNVSNGVDITNSPGNIIGGTTSDAANVISGNGGKGIVISLPGATGNHIEGNLIGTEVDGTHALGNGGGGIFISMSSANIIGGTDATARNIVASNSFGGITLVGSPGNEADQNLVEGNDIGTDSTGKLKLGNQGPGVEIAANSSHNTVGGTEKGAANIIANNTGVGVTVTDKTSTNNAIEQDQIFSNGGLGIDLGLNGVTQNDAGDGDTGPNNFQNYPVLKSATAATKVLKGKLNSTPNTMFALEFFSNKICDSSKYGEGKTFLGQITVTTNGSGNASFTFTTSKKFRVGSALTATATDPHGNTSEFSKCKAAL